MPVRIEFVEASHTVEVSMMVAVDEFPVFSAAFTFVRTAQYAGPFTPSSKAADAHGVAAALLAGDPTGNNIVAAHAIFSTLADLLVVVRGLTDPLIFRR